MHFTLGAVKITSGIFSKHRLEGGVSPLSQKFLTFSDFFCTKKFRFMIPIIIHTPDPNPENQ
eukprot:UN24619